MIIVEGEIIQNGTVSKNLSLLNSTMTTGILFTERLHKRCHGSPVLNCIMSVCRSLTDNLRKRGYRTPILDYTIVSGDFFKCSLPY